MDLSAPLKLLWLYVLDNCDHAGIWKVNVKLAEFKMGVTPPWGEGVGRLPEEFKERVEVAPRLGDYWFIPKFLRHQYGKYLNKGDAFKSALVIIESHGFLESLRRVYGESIDPPRRVAAKAKAKAISKESLKEDKGSGEKGIKNGADDFEDFYNAYPKKAAKAIALKAWQKLNPDEELMSKMSKALLLQKKNFDWIKEDGKFVPHPATWLNQRRWEDEIKGDASGKRDSLDHLMAREDERENRPTGVGGLPDL